MQKRRALVGLKGRREWIGGRGEEVDGRRSSSRFVLGASCPPARTLLAHRQEPTPRRARRKVLSAPPVRGGAEMAVCHHKYAIEKYVTKNMQCYGMLPRVGGYLQGVFCSAFPFKIANIPNHCCDWDSNQHPGHPKRPIFNSKQCQAGKKTMFWKV